MLRSKVQIPKYLIIYNYKPLVLSIGHLWLPSSLANDGSGSRCQTVLWDCFFFTHLLKKPRINSEKPINKAIASPQNSLIVKFIRRNIGPVLTSEWPVIDNISPFLRRSLIPSETVWLIPKQLYCTFL